MEKSYASIYKALKKSYFSGRTARALIEIKIVSCFGQMRIQSNRFLYHVLDKWRGNSASFSFDGNRVSSYGKHAVSTTLSEILKASEIERKWIGSDLSIRTSASNPDLRIRSKKGAELVSFSRHVEQAWRDYNIAQLQAQSEVISAVLAEIEELTSPTRYPSACIVQPVLSKAEELNTKVFSKLNRDAVGEARFRDIEAIQDFLNAPQKLRSEAITRFEIKQLDRWSNFFDSFETNPLTPEQRISVIADEDATLVLAGAGSGKTSVITAKAGYLIEVRNW